MLFDFFCQIQASAYAHQKGVESGERIVVGVNSHLDEGGGGACPLLRVAPSAEAAQRRRLAALRAGRDSRLAMRALDAVETAARGTDNLLPPIIEAVKARATLGEICGRLRRVFGEHRPASAL